MAILAVVVVPSALLILSGHIDLSVGSTVGLTGTITALAVTGWDWPVQWAILAGVGVGGWWESRTDCCAACLNFNPIVVTLGMFPFLARQHPANYKCVSVQPRSSLCRDRTRNIYRDSPCWCGSRWSRSYWAAFPAADPLGRHVYAIGVNTEAAFLAGISVRRLPFILYVATGVAGGIGGLMAVSRLDGAAPAQLGLTLELMVLTAVLVGGGGLCGRARQPLRRLLRGASARRSAEPAWF